MIRKRIINPPMTLNEYLERTGKTQVEFSKESGVAQAVISRILAGGDALGRNWARITEATSGAVTADDHFGKGDAAA